MTCLVVMAWAIVGGTPTGVAFARTVPWPETECIPGSPGETRTSATCGATLVHGRAIAPESAPPVVKSLIKAANHIDGRPYVWGGGHTSFFTKGYDCSGAVSYVLHAAGLLDTTMVSGQLEHWGDPGPGRWITVYANYHHVYIVVAGLRFDTRGDLPGVNGPRWHTDRVDPRNFASRHPVGL
jgi:cell wall-associated NlpC family hydrolase